MKKVKTQLRKTFIMLCLNYISVIGLSKETSGTNIFTSIHESLKRSYLFDKTSEARWIFGSTTYPDVFPMGAINIGYQKTSLSNCRYSHSDDHPLLNAGSDLFADSFCSFVSAGAEISYNKGLSVSPKLSAGVKGILLDADLSLIGFNDFKSFTPSFTPEIGIYPGSVIQINYGYNIYFTENDLKDGYQHRVSVRFTIPTDNFKRRNKV